MMMENLNKEMGVICQNVCVTLGGDKLLKEINLRAEPGTITGLIGRNGSGKTMLMRAICGLVPLSSGIIVVEGQIIGKDVDFSEKIGAIIETPGFLPQYSGIENLRILAKVRGKVGDIELNEALCMVGLQGVNKRVSKYSLGMRQRLGIAQAIMENPSVLILDEPFNGLDNIGTDEMHELLKNIKNKGNTIIIASHDKRDVDDLCDNIYSMENGIINKVT